MTSAHFPINRIDCGGMNFNEHFIVTRSGALHFDLCQNFGSAVLVNSYRFHFHVLRFVVCSLCVSVVSVTISSSFPLTLESSQYHDACAAMPFWHNGPRWNSGTSDISWLLLKR